MVPHSVMPPQMIFEYLSRTHGLLAEIMRTHELVDTRFHDSQRRVFTTGFRRRASSLCKFSEAGMRESVTRSHCLVDRRIVWREEGSTSARSESLKLGFQSGRAQIRLLDMVSTLLQSPLMRRSMFGCIHSRFLRTEFFRDAGISTPRNHRNHSSGLLANTLMSAATIPRFLTGSTTERVYAL